MEITISTFCKNLASFCNHIESATQSLSDSIHRRPIPLDSAASSFLNSINRRVTDVSTDLNFLDSMASGTVSFEELIGHCNEVYKANDKYVSQIEDRLKSFGYVPGLEAGEGDDDIDLDFELLSPIEPRRFDFNFGPVSAARSERKKLDEGLLFEDPLSLKNFGLSDACLATLSLEDNDQPASLLVPSSELAARTDDSRPQMPASSYKPQMDVSIASDGDIAKPSPAIQISKDEYDCLPAYMKKLASWEELEEAVVKFNDYLRKKEEAMESAAINQDDLEALDLGHKGRSYLLLLLRMKRVIIETIDGAIRYRACVS